VFASLFSLIIGPLNLALERRLWLVLMTVVTGLTGYVLYGIFAVQLVKVEALGDWVRGNATSHRLTPLISFIFALGGSGIGIGTWFIQARYNRSSPEIDEKTKIK